ncbi:hypothetical protein [Vreelandella boliviensis]|uniref:hypothetical protein n=1 Tax=Vreelandella boliviensis TaxID=223527 RepID=UPI001B8A8CB7|nr:hypothetical protein [Halomonas boliviensis]MBS3666452.1 hypothetical protein [Halomonas boliviensis]
MTIVRCGARPELHPAGAARSGVGVGVVPLGVVPTPPAGASKRSLNSRSRYHALRDVHEAETVGFVARRKRQRTRAAAARRESSAKRGWCGATGRRSDTSRG